MRYRTIKKGSDTGRLDRAEVRAAIVAIHQRRDAARSRSGVAEACETPRAPHVEPASGEAQ